MKKIKIAFSGYGDSFLDLPFDQNYLIDVLSERYDVSVTSVPDADYVFCGIWGKPYEYCGVDQVRIMIEGENYIPDFNYIDYAVSPYPIQLYDRNFYVPCGVEALICHRYRHLLSLTERIGGGIPMIGLKIRSILPIFCPATIRKIITAPNFLTG